MDFSSVYVLLLSSILLLSPLSASTILSGSIHISHSNPYPGISLFSPADGFQPPDSPDSGENLVEPPPPAYQGDTSGSSQASTPNNGNIDFSPPPDNVLPGSPQLPYVSPPSMPNDDGIPPSIMPFVPPPTSNAPVPASPQLPFAIPSPTGNPLPTPQLPFTSAPPDSSLPESPQLPFASSPPSYNAFPGSLHSPLAYHHPNGAQPSTSLAPSPFGVNPSGQNQIQQFGQSNAGLFGQPQGLNDVPSGGNGEYGGCSSPKVNLVATAIALLAVLLISWF